MDPSELAVIGYGLLASVASHKRDFIGYGESRDLLVGRGVDILCGASRPGHGQNWCGPIKGMCCEVARINLANNEPLLACLVRRKDGTIGKGYATAVEIRYGITLSSWAQIQAHADAERVKCWAYFGLS
jgi:hypothetical protein